MILSSFPLPQPFLYSYTSVDSSYYYHIIPVSFEKNKNCLYMRAESQNNEMFAKDSNPDNDFDLSNKELKFIVPEL
jgi:hypothetical protein